MDILFVMGHSSYSFGYGTSTEPSNIKELDESMKLSTILLCDPMVGTSYLKDSPLVIFNMLVHMLSRRGYDGTTVPKDIVVEDAGLMDLSVDELRNAFNTFIKQGAPTTPGEQRFMECKGVLSESDQNGGNYFNRPYEFFEGNRPFGCVFLIQTMTGGNVLITDVLSDFKPGKTKGSRSKRKRKTRRFKPITLTRTQLFRHVHEEYLCENILLVDGGCSTVNGDVDACERFEADQSIL